MSQPDRARKYKEEPAAVASQQMVSLLPVLPLAHTPHRIRSSASAASPAHSLRPASLDRWKGVSPNAASRRCHRAVGFILAHPRSSSRPSLHAAAAPASRTHAHLVTPAHARFWLHGNALLAKQPCYPSCFPCPSLSHLSRRLPAHSTCPPCLVTQSAAAESLRDSSLRCPPPPAPLCCQKSRALLSLVRPSHPIL